MNLTREIERRIENKKQEISELEKQLGESRAYLKALQDTARWLPKSGEEPTLRPGTDLAKARDLIRAKGHPLHITEILKGIPKEVNKANRISLSGSLSGYARKGNIFSKPAPNTFGLIELENIDEDKGAGGKLVELLTSRLGESVEPPSVTHRLPVPTPKPK